MQLHTANGNWICINYQIRALKSLWIKGPCRASKTRFHSAQFQFNIYFTFLLTITVFKDRLCGLEVRVPGWYQRSRVRLPALPDFLSSSGTGTGSTQPREDKWGATWKKSSGSGLENLKLTTVGDPPRWPRDTPLCTKVGTKFRRPVAAAQSV
jgi:hypothetical protein